jgi:hypothetical protein
MQRSTEMTDVREGESGLTGFLTRPASRRDLERQLEEAGLELWQAPEGFWTVRLKQAVLAPVNRARRLRRAR